MSVALEETVVFEYERAYDRHSKDVFRFLLAWTNDWSSAEDLTHEAYLRLWQHRGSIDWSRPILAWLLVTARRLASNRFRTLRRRIAPKRPETSADELVLIRWIDLQRALALLTSIERVALILTAVEGWSSEDAASVLGSSPGAVRAAASRARAKLEGADV